MQARRHRNSFRGHVSASWWTSIPRNFPDRSWMHNHIWVSLRTLKFLSLFFPSQDVDSVHRNAAVTHVTRVLMQSCSAGAFMMASTLDWSEIIIFRTFPVSPPTINISIHWFLVSIFVKVTGSLSGLCGPPVIASLSLTKRASLYHDSSVFVLYSLPPGNPWPNCRPPVTDWVMYFHESSGQISKLTCCILSFWHLQPRIQMPCRPKFASE